MKIAVVGSINMDITVIADRIPSKGETIFGKEVLNAPGGKGANQAVALARLGAVVEMFGCVGNDNNGLVLLENLEKQGVLVQNIKKQDNVCTGLAFITVGEDDNTIVVVAGANTSVDKAYIDSIKNELIKCETVLLQNEIPKETVEYLIEICNENNIRVILNPAPFREISEEYIKMLDYITPNEHEAKLLFCGKYDLEKLLKKYPEKVVITKGSKGVQACTKRGDIITIPSIKASVVDTTGAGDTFNATLAYALTKSSDLKDALLFANTSAGISTEKIGAQTGMPNLEEVLERMKG